MYFLLFLMGNKAQFYNRRQNYYELRYNGDVGYLHTYLLRMKEPYSNMNSLSYTYCGCTKYGYNKVEYNNRSLLRF